MASTILIGGKGGAGPSSVHTTLEGTNGVSECKMDVKSAWILTWHKWVMFHGYLDYFQKPSLGGRPNVHETKRPWHSEHSQMWLYLILSCVRTRMSRNSSK